jgi:hypothetical protein
MSSKASPAGGAATTAAESPIRTPPAPVPARAPAAPAADLRLGDWLPRLRPHLARTWVGDLAFDRLRRIARHLPGDVLTALEIRLGPDPADVSIQESPVDLSVRLATAEQARDVAPCLPPSHLQALLRDWADAAPALRPVHSFWLEFDLDEDPGEHLPAPVVCARIAKGPFRRDVGWLLEELFPRLHGTPLAAAQETWIRRGVEAIPPTCRLLYAFSLGARPGNAVRLEVYGEDLDELLRYLAAVSPELRRTAEPARETFEGVERLHVSFDVGRDELGERVGVEGSFRKIPSRDPRWDAFLSRFPVEVRDFGSWPGASRSSETVVVRGLSHLKRAYDALGPQAAKVYLTAFEPPSRLV